jgi:hypothetical protein
MKIGSYICTIGGFRDARSESLAIMKSLRDQKTIKRQLVLVFMLAQDNFLGMHEVNPMKIGSYICTIGGFKGCTK